MAAIDKFHGITLPGGTAPLQVRFSDSPAQKKLKIAVANKRKVMKTGPMPFGIRRRSEIDEQYMYAAAPDYYDMSGAMPSYAPLPMAMPDMAGAGGQMPAVYWQQGMPMMAQMPGIAPVRTSPNEDRSASRTPPEVDLVRVNSQGMLSVPRSPSDLGQSAEISAASDFESTGDMDELTARVKELMYEGGASDEGADETVVTRGNGLDGELVGWVAAPCSRRTKLTFSFSSNRMVQWKASRHNNTSGSSDCVASNLFFFSGLAAYTTKIPLRNA